MAHEIEGQKFAGTQLAWHRVGKVVDHPMTAEEAMEQADMDTVNEKRRIWIKEEDELIEIPDYRAVVRLDDLRVLGVVKDAYHIIQNREAFGFMDSIIGEGRAVYETAGSLRNGSRMFLTVKLEGSVNIGPDKIDKYLCLSSSHDGSLALRVHWTPVRVVCANTLRASLQGFQDGLNGIAVYHHKNYKDRISEARKVLDLTDEYYAQMEIEWAKMLGEEMTKANFAQFVEKLFPKQETETTHRKNAKEKLAGLFNGGAGHDAIANTRWAAYNAVAQYVDHEKTCRGSKRASQDSNRMESAMWGGGYRMKQQAFDLLRVN